MTTEALLADVVGPVEAPVLFEWLRGLTFVEQGPDGLFPHDVAREVLDADLRWRDPEGFRDLHGPVLRYLVRRLQARTGREQQRAYFDFVYLSRNSALMRSYYDWDAMGTAYAEPATPEDHSDILAMVRRHEGEAAERMAAYWLGRRPDAFLAFRSTGTQLAGFAATLLLDAADTEECPADPSRSAANDLLSRGRNSTLTSTPSPWRKPRSMAARTGKKVFDTISGTAKRSIFGITIGSYAADVTDREAVEEAVAEAERLTRPRRWSRSAGGLASGRPR